MMNYSSCPACGGKRSKEIGVGQVRMCSRCKALYGQCYKGDSYRLVKPSFHPNPSEVTEERCYDFTTVGSAGVERRHGWYDPETNLITQVG